MTSLAEKQFPVNPKSCLMQDKHEGGALAAQARVSSNHGRHDPDGETDASISHIFPFFIKHRVWKRQPRGGSIGVETVPLRIIPPFSFHSWDCREQRFGIGM